MRPGELAKRTGVSLQTLRYYERRGLLPDPGRSLGGHRDYDDDAEQRVRAIRAVQRLGFTLDQIAELLAIGSHRGPRPGLAAHAREKIIEIDRRIADLSAMRADLSAVVEAGCADLMDCTCEPECPIPFTSLVDR